jgi:hypothetical protein
MAMRDRLRRVEERASGHLITVRCPECGEEIRAGDDLALEVLAASWARETGMKHEVPPVVDMILDHEHAAILRTLFPEVASSA